MTEFLDRRSLMLATGQYTFHLDTCQAHCHLMNTAQMHKTVGHTLSLAHVSSLGSLYLLLSDSLFCNITHYQSICAITEFLSYILWH